MSPVVGTKPVVLAKLVNPYLLPRAIGFDPRVFHVIASTPTFQHCQSNESLHQVGPG
jgi:hypothetical protein